MYESDLVKTANTTILTTMTSDNRGPITSTSSSSKTYEYTNGSVTAASEIFTNGRKSITSFKNGLMHSSQESDNGGAFAIVIYDEKGRPSVQTMRGTEYQLFYDQKGNLITVKTLIQGNLSFQQEMTYDHSQNPETLVINKFKGIPDPLERIKGIDGVNNQVSSESINIADNTTFLESNQYVYNAQQLPETSVHEYPGAKEFTTYKYNCR